MKSFKQFLAEIKLHKDYRDSPNKKFFVSYKDETPNPDYKYDMATHKTNGQPMYIPHHKFSLHNANVSQYNNNNEDEKKDLLGAASKSFFVDPKTKIIDLDVESVIKYRNRRKNMKLGASKSNKWTNETPIVYGGRTELNNQQLFKLFKDLHKKHPIHDYKITGAPEHEGKTVKEFIDSFKDPQQQMLKREPMVAYHGTSTKRAKEILQTGLKKSKRTEEYPDLVIGYSNSNIYLTHNSHEASNYATREAINDGSSPTILKVNLQPHHVDSIRKDEDNLHISSTIHPELLKRLYKKYPFLSDVHFHSITKSSGELPTGKKIKHPWRDNDTMDEHQKVTASFDNPIYWGRIEGIPPGHNEISWRQHLGKEIRNAFMASHPKLNKETSFAITKEVHPKHISVFKRWLTKSTKRDPSDKEFYDAIDTMKKTIKDKL